MYSRILYKVAENGGVAEKIDDRVKNQVQDIGKRNMISAAQYNTMSSLEKNYSDQSLTNVRPGISETVKVEVKIER